MDICYNYSPDTGEYLGSSQFRRDPLENLPLIPANATETAPPETPAGYAAVFSDGVWSLVEDHRGESGYIDGVPAVVTGLGPLPGGWSPTAPQPTLTWAKAVKSAEVQAEKSRARDGGFLVDGTLFDSDEAARVAYLELAMKLQSDPGFSTNWKASDGIWVTMNAALFALVYVAGAAHIAACFAWQASKDAEIAAAQTVEEVQAVSATYEE